MAYDFSTHFPYRFCEFDLTSDQLYKIIGLGIDSTDGSLIENNLMAPKLIQLSVYEWNGQPRFAAVLEARREKAKKITIPVIEQYNEDFLTSLQSYQAEGNPNYYYITNYNVGRVGGKIWFIAIPSESPFAEMSIDIATGKLYAIPSGRRQVGFGGLVTSASVTSVADIIAEKGHFISQISGHDPNGIVPTKNPSDLIMSFPNRGGGPELKYSYLNIPANLDAPVFQVEMDIKNMDKYLNEMSHEKGWQLTDLNGYSYLKIEPGKNQVALYNAIMTKKAGPPWLASLDLTRTELATLLTELPENNYRVDQVTGYDLNGETRFALRGSAPNRCRFLF